MQAADKINRPEAFGWMKKPESVPKDQIKETVEADVVIIGAGQAGTCAARAASEKAAALLRHGTAKGQPSSHRSVL